MRELNPLVTHRAPIGVGANGIQWCLWLSLCIQ